MGVSRVLYPVVCLVLAVAACGDNIHPDVPKDGGADALVCPAGQLACEGVCVDPLVNHANCGMCGNDCGTGTCMNGLCCAPGTQLDNNVCCPAGQHNDNGICCPAGTVNDVGVCCATGTHNDNGICCPAGALNDNGVCCALGTHNDNGICCATGLHNCGGTCVDEQTAHDHCGACDNACSSSQTCSSGNCCTTGQVYCNNTCVDENQNCGMCGHACAGATTCSDGLCCPPGQVNCGGTCVDEQTDPNNCGTCGTVCTNGSCNSGLCCPVGQVNDNGLCCPVGQHNDSGICCGTGQVNCGGTCVDEQTSNTNCGTCGHSCGTDSCSAGLCCPTGTVNTGGTCCAIGLVNCGGSCVNPNADPNCGACGASCSTTGETCQTQAGSTALCCPAGEVNCSGTCADRQTDDNNCGACGNACGTGNSCSGGVCCPTGTVNTGGICCPSGDINCSGACVNPNNDPNCGTCGTNCSATGGSCQGQICCGAGTTNCGGTCVDLTTDSTHCGTCATACATGQTCKNGTPPECCGTGENNCSGLCSNPLTDNANCGACGNACGTGQSCSAGLCCPTGQTNCNGTCVDLNTSNAHCGTCGTDCTATSQICNGAGSCTASCDPPNSTTCGVCTNINTDPFNCGPGCAVCPVGAACSAGTCGSCPASKPDVCGSPLAFCVDEQSDPNNCGGCGVNCNGDVCDQGMCCPAGQINCGGQCVDPQSDEQNCGGCGAAFACGTGQTCNAGTCECPSGETLCGSSCIVTSTDPNHCGSCNNVCSGATPFCVSNGCTGSCPAPLVACGTKCVDPEDDNQHCGGCPGTACGPGNGCSAGSCVPVVVLQPPPAGKCDNGGPPIVVPTGGGNQTCAGNLGAVSFTFGLCSRTSIGPLSRAITLDAFDSTLGPYVPGGVGGGLGVNGTINDTALMTIGGDFIASANDPGANPGMNAKGDVIVKQRLADGGAINYSKSFTVAGAGHCSISTTQTCSPAAQVGHLGSCPGSETCVGIVGASVQGPWSTGGGNADMTIGGVLTTPVCTRPPLPAANTLAFDSCNPAAVDLAPPCENDPLNLVPVRSIVDHFATTNDNASIGLVASLLDNPSATVRLDLPCGYYYLNSINASKPITIVVHGHTALFIAGSIRVSQQLILDLDPDATLDIFVGGVLNVSNDVILGSPAYPRLSRLYFGSPGCLGSGTCSNNADCCSGQCVGGTCVSSGGNLSQAISLSNSGHYNGLLWAGYGTFTHSNPMEMYGSVFANYFDASGETTIHYDNGTVSAPNECPPPSGACDGCQDCNNQACVNGTCGACTSDAQCCQPLHCVNPGPNGVCKL